MLCVIPVQKIHLLASMLTTELVKFAYTLICKTNIIQLIFFFFFEKQKYMAHGNKINKFSYFYLLYYYIYCF